MMEDGDAELAPTRKRKFSKREVLELLKEKEGDLEKVVGEICDELVPFDVTNEEELQVNDRLERMANAASVHRIMCHSWEVIQMNDSFGLGDVSEEGLELLNKNIRQMKEHGARKVTTEDNFRDCYNHLWDRSRPTIVEMDRIIKRKDPKVISFNSAVLFFGHFRHYLLPGGD